MPLLLTTMSLRFTGSVCIIVVHEVLCVSLWLTDVLCGLSLWFSMILFWFLRFTLCIIVLHLGKFRISFVHSYIIVVHCVSLCDHSDVFVVHKCSRFVVHTCSLMIIVIIAFIDVLCGNCSSLMYQRRNRSRILTLLWFKTVIY